MLVIRHEAAGRGRWCRRRPNLTSDDSSDRVRSAAYGLEKWQRLVALKRKYDPTNLSSMYANIPPTAGQWAGRSSRFTRSCYPL